MANILIIDDELGIRKTLGLFLEIRGHRTYLAEDVRTGLSTLAAQHVDAVICDVLLPNRSGLEFLEEVRKSQPTLPVIMISGEPTRRVKQIAKNLNAYDFLAKPIHSDTICKLVDQALGSVRTTSHSKPEF